MSKKIRVIYFGIFVGVFLASYSIGATYKMSDAEMKDFLKEFQSTTQGIDAVGIFLHNITDDLPMFIPGFGAAWGAYIGGSTGASFSALVSTNPDLAKIPPLTVLLATPYGIMELVAYAIAMSRSFLLIGIIIKRKSLKKETRNTLIEIGIAVVLLLVAGVMESMMVNNHL